MQMRLHCEITNAHRFALLVPLLLCLSTSARAAVVSLPEHALIVPVGGTTTAALSIDDATGVEAALIRVTYDDQLVSATGVNETTLTNACLMESNTSVAGEILISMACIDPLTGSGPLFQISFTGQAGGSSAMTVAECTLNEGSPSCTPVGGNIMVTDCALDVDGSGSASPFSDIVYIFRYLAKVPHTVPLEYRDFDPSIPPDSVIEANTDFACP